MSSRPRLALYYYSSCSYCIRVRRVAAELGIELELRNIHERPEHRGDLVRATGRQTVPVLRIESATGDQWLPESEDIIEYLRGLAKSSP